jgi:RNA polymerase sigma-70 factor (ECF subfamily)
MTDQPPVRDREAVFRRLWEANASRVYAYARRRVDADAASDIVADSFLVAWRRLEDVPEEALPWLLGVARRVIANRTRGERRRARLIAKLEQVTDREAALGGSDLEGATDLGAALQRLKPADREVLLLVAWDELDHDQAAAVLGCRPQTFAVRLHRARRRLARELADDAEERIQLARPEIAQGAWRSQ